MGNWYCPEEADGFTEENHWRPLNRQIHVIIVCCDYTYSKGNELTATTDGKNFRKMLHKAQDAAAQAEGRTSGVDIVAEMTYLEDMPNLMAEVGNQADPMFPTKGNVTAQIIEAGKRCKPNDWFIFFYAGHGENVPDVDGDEETGMDEAYVTPGPQGQLRPKDFFVDDDFADALEMYIPPECNIMVISDCCHSASIVDINSRTWKKNHKILSISACQEYSIHKVYEYAYKQGIRLCNEQQMEMQHHNMDPKLTAWPLVYPN
jgi:hypothetical protein